MGQDQTQNSARNCLEKVFEERQQFILIGLTGRTGSGCSTAGNLLSKTFEDIDPQDPKNDEYSSDEERKYRIIYEYAQPNWNKFIHIKVADILTTFIIESGFSKLKSHLIQNYSFKDSMFKESEIEKNIGLLKEKIDSIINFPLDKINNNELYNTVISDIPGFKAKLKNFLNIKSRYIFIKLFQEIGNNIRNTGKPYSHDPSDYNSASIYEIPMRLNNVIKLIREHHKLLNKEKEGNNNSFIVIDAIRNVFESKYFSDRYSAFYLFSIKCDDEERKSRLRVKYNLNDEELKDIDDTEYSGKKSDLEKFTHLNVKDCIRESDVHLYNPTKTGEDYSLLARQILKYISLIMHPGLVTPTKEERLMQIAHSAKLNSGCISLQVGAVVADVNYSIKAIGWNDTAKGQTPCLLRNSTALLKKQDNISYSQYEKSEKFSVLIEHTYKSCREDENLHGRSLPYCFKDVENKYNNEKNQVHTRALHAEENAFLQLTKYGSTGINGGLLFVTATPCVLCSKKSYQLGISKIYYIDPYPDISESHILSSGTNCPELVLYYGAVGKSYSKLFEPVMSYKDELQILLNLQFKVDPDKASNK